MVRRHQLITPHGDWKLGNSSLSFKTLLPLDHSLPLMGIGNSTAWRTTAASARSASTHYPSWGLETYAAHFTSLAALCSLPLMGIGNSQTGDVISVNPLYSLPLMGIGNSQAFKGRTAGLTLITPHGDWKRLWPPAHYALAFTHYPSWGLETRHRPAPDRRQTSLPLMGIGNRIAALGSRDQSVSHYPSWGLETSHSAGYPISQRELITPHGDWKPLFLLDFCKLHFY